MSAVGIRWGGHTHLTPRDDHDDRARSAGVVKRVLASSARHPEFTRDGTSATLVGAEAALRERVDPAFESSRLPAHQLRIVKGVGEQCCTLDAAEEGDGEVARVAPAELPELLLGPVYDEGEHVRGFSVEAVVALAELGAKAADRTAVEGDGVVDLLPRAGEPLEASLRGAMTLEAVEEHSRLPAVAVDHCRDELVLRLEVVVDVPGGDVCALGHLGQRRSLHALLVHECSGALHEPFAFALCDRS